MAASEERTFSSPKVTTPVFLEKTDDLFPANLIEKPLALLIISNPFHD